MILFVPELICSVLVEASTRRLVKATYFRWTESGLHDNHEDRIEPGKRTIAPFPANIILVFVKVRT
jgi:hypothetical protein